MEPREDDSQQGRGAHDQLAQPGRRFDKSEIEQAVRHGKDKDADQHGAGERPSSGQSKPAPADDDKQDQGRGRESNARSKERGQLSPTDPDGDRTATSDHGQSHNGGNPVKS